MRHIYLFVVLLTLVTLLQWACGEDAPEAPAQPKTLAEVIDGAGAFEDFVETHTVSEDSTLEEDIGGEIYHCTRRTHNVTEGYPSHPRFSPNAEVIYPGNLLQGATLSYATPSPIVVRRGPGTILMTVMNGASIEQSVQRAVPEVTHGNIQDAANDIIDGVADLPLAANTTFEFHNVTSKQELSLAIGADFSTLENKIQGAFDYEESHSYNRMVVKLTQEYYTMAYELPTSYSQVFHPSVTAEQLSRYVGPGNPAAFISSVSYGRIFYLLFQSTSSSYDVGIRVRAYIKAAVTADVSFSADYINELTDVRVTGYAFGGDAGLAATALLGNFDDITAYLADTDIREGVPLSYQVRSVSRPDQIVKAKVATEYDEIECVSIGKAIEEALLWYRADDPEIETDDSDTTLVSLLPDANRNTSMDATPVEIGHFGGRLIHGVVPAAGGAKPAIRFYAEPGLVDGAFRHNGGSGFTDADYTVFVLVRLADLQVPYPAYFMFGTSGTELKNLSIGFWGPERLVMSHRGYDFAADLQDYRADEFNLYVFRFSRLEGMSIYAGGDLAQLGSDPAMTSALTSYPSPRIGANEGRMIDIAEIIALDGAASLTRMQAIVKRLRERYVLN